MDKEGGRCIGNDFLFPAAIVRFHPCGQLAIVALGLHPIYNTSMTIPQALHALEAFQGDSLTENLAIIEAAIVGLGMEQLQSFCLDRNIDHSFMASAASIKKVAGQINVIIHAAGILCSLPHILKPGEIIQSVSLGAGNTGRMFDLETSHRVAEYKFIDWQGGPESIRQNSLFKDFFELAEFETKKSKQLFVVGTGFPIRFLSGGRALTSVLKQYPAILHRIITKYGSDIIRTRDYYDLKKEVVEIVDVSPYIGRDI